MVTLRPEAFESLPKSFKGLLKVGLTFSQYGIHPSLIHYLCKSHATKFLYDACLEAVYRRQPWIGAPMVGFLPSEFRKFQTVFELMSGNDRAYELAIMDNPGPEEIDEFCKCRIGFTTCFAAKMFIMNHPSIARAYRGVLPFGGPVKRAYNEMVFEKINGTPRFDDHLRLRDLCNTIADQMGVTSMLVNNYLYLEGLEKKAETEDEEVANGAA